jgi:hypothetical protein
MDEKDFGKFLNFIFSNPGTAKNFNRERFEGVRVPSLVRVIRAEVIISSKKCVI